MYNLIFDLYPA